MLAIKTRIADTTTRISPRKSEREYVVCDGIVLRVPVMQAVLGSCDGPELAAAVSRAGALGCLSVRTPTPDAFASTLCKIRRRTGKPVVLAFNAEWEPESVLSTSLENGFRHFGLFWWNGARLSRRIHEAGGKVLWQVGTLEQARDALDCGADVLIAQGTDAGGQVRSPHPIREFLPELLNLCGDRNVPVIAGGGLATRADVGDMLAGGAVAALFGTRFLLSAEATAPYCDKRRLLDAATGDLLLDPNLVGDWPCAPRRRLAVPGVRDRSSLFSGCGLDRIHVIKTAAEIVASLNPSLLNH